MRVLDLFCGAGGAGYGYHLAGHEVTGVDLHPQPDYPFVFVQGDAVAYAWEHAHEFDFIHASPPCQHFSSTTKNKDKHPNLIPSIREALLASSRPFVIENVVPAVKRGPLRRDLTLCGEMFGLQVVRHRVFEVHGVEIPHPAHLDHRGRAKASGRRSRGDYTTEGYYFSVYGAGTDKGTTSEWQDAMGIHWTSVRKSIAEAIPPAYTRYIGSFLDKQP